MGTFAKKYGTKKQYAMASVKHTVLLWNFLVQYQYSLLVMSQHKILKCIVKTAVKLYTLKRFMILWFTDLVFIVTRLSECFIQFCLCMCQGSDISCVCIVFTWCDMQVLDYPHSLSLQAVSPQWLAACYVLFFAEANKAAVANKWQAL